MKKKYLLGKIDAYGRNKVHAVEVTIELSGDDRLPVFTASGEVWNATHTDIIMGGQCLEELNDYSSIKSNPTFQKILKLWRKYHLNDMHPECEHQEALGWKEKAVKQVNIYTFTMNADALRAQKALKDKVLQAAKDGSGYVTTQDERLLLGLEYAFRTHCDTLPENIAKFYKLEYTEQKALGWLEEKYHPDGILAKPCPVCGYKYGTAWKYRPIDDDDLDLIKKMIEE